MARKKATQEYVLLERAKKRLRLAEDAESRLRPERTEDLKFLNGDQWPTDVRLTRQADKRPCLTINMLPKFLNHIVNDQKQNRPDIVVDPVADGATEETSDVLQGLIRHIVYDSRADNAIDEAFKYAVATGLGYFRIITEYENDEAFDQVLKIKPIFDPDSVFFDPTSMEVDGSDSKWCFIVEDLLKDEYERLFPDSKVTQSLNNLTEYVNKAPEWIRGDSIRIAEYYEIDYKLRELCLFEDGASFYSDEIPEEYQGQAPQRTRKVSIPKVMWYKLNGVEILDQTEWLVPWIPVIPVKGIEMVVEGQKVQFGIIRFARDVQRRYNYLRSAEAEIIALQPRVPYVAAAGQLDNFKNEWEQANNRNFAYLEYDPIDANGQPVGPPQRQAFGADTSAVVASVMQAGDELKSTTSIYDDALGAGTNEKSGRAIMARQNQSQSANYHFNDNLNKSLRHAGRILISGIQKYMDAPRIVRILHEDGDNELVRLNAEYIDDTGKQRHHPVDIGRYDVIIHSGPSYQTKRQEAAAWLQEVMRGNQQLMQIAGDILFRNLDLPGANELAERFKKILPPQLQDNKNNVIPPEAQNQITAMRQQLEQGMQMVQQLSEALHESSRQLEGKQAELDAKERISDREIQVKLLIEMEKLNSKEAMQKMELLYSEFSQRIDSLDGMLNSGNNAQQPTLSSQIQPNMGQQPQVDVSNMQLPPVTGAVSPGDQGLPGGNDQGQFME